MITGAQARAAAEANWGKDGTRAYKTNRKGAFYYSCSGHGGFVVDARCLTQDERARIDRYATPEIAHEVVQADGSVRKFRNPFSQRSLTYYTGVETIREVEIFFFEEDSAWAIPAVCAGIIAKNASLEAALDTMRRNYDLSPEDAAAFQKTIQNAGTTSPSPA